MSLESADFIPGLVESNPEGTDPKSQGDDHLRLLKHVLKSQFPAFVGAPVTLTEAQINALAASGAGGPGIHFDNPDLIPLISGFFVCFTPTGPIPTFGGSGDTVLQIVAASGARTQLWMKLDGRLAVRGWNGSWGAWQYPVNGIKQASLFDGTAGAIELVGAFGLGGFGSASPAFNIDAPAQIPYSCLIGRTVSVTGTFPPGSVEGDMLIHLAYNANVCYQEMHCFAAAQVFRRQIVSGVPTAWQGMVPLGVGQTWQNVSASRLFNVSYPNSTNKPIEVSVSAASGVTNAQVYIEASVSGVSIGLQQINANAGGTFLPFYGTLSFTVPPGGTYMIAPNGAATLHRWAELRA